MQNGVEEGPLRVSSPGPRHTLGEGDGEPGAGKVHAQRMVPWMRSGAEDAIPIVAPEIVAAEGAGVWLAFSCDHEIRDPVETPGHPAHFVPAGTPDIVKAEDLRRSASLL